MAVAVGALGTGEPGPAPERVAAEDAAARPVPPVRAEPPTDP